MVIVEETLIITKFNEHDDHDLHLVKKKKLLNLFIFFKNLIGV